MYGVDKFGKIRPCITAVRVGPKRLSDFIVVEYSLAGFVHFCLGTLADVVKYNASFPQKYDGYDCIEVLLETRSCKLEVGYVTNERTPERLPQALVTSIRARRQDFPSFEEKIEICHLHWCFVNSSNRLALAQPEDYLLQVWKRGFARHGACDMIDLVYHYPPQE
jgi:hypothetical protein